MPFLNPKLVVIFMYKKLLSYVHELLLVHAAFNSLYIEIPCGCVD
jgi:hypothetical protein